MTLRSRFTAIAVLAAAVALSAPQAAAATPRTRDHPVPTSGCRRATPLPAGSTVSQTIDSGGYQRTYLIHLPARYDPEQPTPVVLAFHGRKGKGADIEAFAGIDALDAIAVYPNGLPAGPEHKTAWEGAPYSPPSDDVLFVSNLLDHLQDTLCVDPQRIYATGKSNGGGFTALLACHLQHRIAAFAPVSGAFYPESAAGCGPGTPVPMMEFHGTADPIIEYGGGESHGEPFPAIPDWLHRWARHDHCGPSTSNHIGNDVTEVAWRHCAAHSAVVHYRIDGAGHTWPGELTDSGPGSATHTISATQVMWRFFRHHPLHHHD